MKPAAPPETLFNIVRDIPILMEYWYREIIASNWPGAPEIAPMLAPRSQA